jgi:beta-lactamase class A
MVLVERIREAAEVFDGVLGVSVRHLGTGEEASVNGDELFPTASVFKVPVLVELYRQVDSGRMDLDEKIFLLEKDMVPGSGILKELSEGLVLSVGDLINLMMILSDNTATDIITEKVGLENVKAMLGDLGFEKTKIIADCRDILFDLVGLNDVPDEEKTMELYREAASASVSGGSWSLGVEGNDVTTPDEMTRLLGMIAEGEAASRGSCDAILGIMGRCQTGRYRLPKYLPSGAVKIAHKTGSLPGIRNDCGVLTLKQSGEFYVISCFTKDAGDVYGAEEAIARASKNVYDYFSEK